MKDYAPDDVIIIVGTHVVVGYAEGTFVTVARDNDSFSDQSGADGEVARARSNDRRGTITLTLMHTSLSNAFLSGLVVLDEASGGGIIPVTVRDKNGTTLHTAAEAWVLKPADAPYGQELDTREWSIRCAALEYFEGGKTPVGA